MRSCVSMLMAVSYASRSDAASGSVSRIGQAVGFGSLTPGPRRPLVTESAAHAHHFDQALDYTGKVVVVTGGARGVGRGITEAFLAAGAEVVICGRNEPAPTTYRPPAGRQAVFVAADVRDADQAAAVVDRRDGAFGRLDVLVNNAGGSPACRRGRRLAPASSPRSSPSTCWRPSTAPRPPTRSCRPRSQGGVIVNIASVSGAAAFAWDRRLRRGQGRAHQPDPDPGHRVGPEGAGQLRRGRHGRTPRRPTTTTGTRPGSGGGRHRAPRAHGHPDRHRRDLSVPGLSPGLLRVGGGPRSPRRRRVAVLLAGGARAGGAKE